MFCPVRREIVGFVTEVGAEVKAFKLGDRVGVGCMVGSCQTCDSCAEVGGSVLGTWGTGCTLSEVSGVHHCGTIVCISHSRVYVHS